MGVKNTNPAEDALKKALALDKNSEEEKAIKHYKNAIKLGLSPENELIAKICLGSSLRVIGKTNESIRVLSAPAKKSTTAFLFKALSLYESGNFKALSKDLIKELFKVLNEQGNVNPSGFERALSRYIKKLKKQPV